jgi:glycosyltransferase involved in cell wall biosynthesis
MRLLILTQIVDKDDTFLGFFHHWIDKFAHEFETITVICLKEGEHDLPENVRVLSLGKEDGVGKFTYIVRFFKYIWRYRKNYDAVFVHMNQEYILLGGWLWRLMGKRVTMWRNHFAGSMLTDVASVFCHKVFCTSKYSYTAKYKKTVFMPVGVPEDVFYVDESITRTPNSILSFVRISPAKKIEQLIEALGTLKEKGVEFTATICGDATPELKYYEAQLHRQVKELNLEERVTFTPGIPYDQVPMLYNKHEISVNQSPSGMFDKTIFEAMLCGTTVLSCNKNLQGEIDDIFVFEEDNLIDLTKKLKQILLLEENEKKERAKSLSTYALNNHSLNSLAISLKKELIL